jgi:hypothetical protein
MTSRELWIASFLAALASGSAAHLAALKYLHVLRERLPRNFTTPAFKHSFYLALGWLLLSFMYGGAFVMLEMRLDDNPPQGTFAWLPRALIWCVFIVWAMAPAVDGYRLGKAKAKYSD